MLQYSSALIYHLILFCFEINYFNFFLLNLHNLRLYLKNFINKYLNEIFSLFVISIKFIEMILLTLFALFFMPICYALTGFTAAFWFYIYKIYYKKEVKIYLNLITNTSQIISFLNKSTCKLEREIFGISLARY